MPKREPGLWDYAKAAFFARRHVPGLGGVPLNVLAVLGFTVAALVNPGFILLGAGFEVAYLAWKSQSERFRKIVRGQVLLDEAQTFAERLDAVVKTLGRESVGRFNALADKIERVRRATGALGSEAVPDVREVSEGGLNSLLMIHARLLHSRETLLAFMREAGRADLDRRLAEATGRLGEATTEPMKRSVEANVEILKRRIQHREAAEHNLQVVESELERIENQVDLVREEIAVSRDPSILSARIDAITGTIGEASQFLQANEVLLGDLSPLGSEEPPVSPFRRVAEKE